MVSRHTKKQTKKKLTIKSSLFPHSHLTSRMLSLKKATSYYPACLVFEQRQDNETIKSSGGTHCRFCHCSGFNYLRRAKHTTGWPLSKLFGTRSSLDVTFWNICIYIMRSICSALMRQGSGWHLIHMLIRSKSHSSHKVTPPMNLPRHYSCVY